MSMPSPPLPGGSRLVCLRYEGACGTGGMLAMAEGTLRDLTYARLAP